MRSDLEPLGMGSRLARNWQLVVLRGVLAILFGLVALFLPAMTLAVLIFLFGAFVLVGGVLLVIAAFRDRFADVEGWLLLIEGVLGIVVGVLILIWPGVTALALLYLMAAWAIVTGIFEIMAAIRLRQEIANEWLLVIAGVASIIFGGLLVLQPGTGALAILMVLAVYAIVFGGLLMVLGFRLRRWYSRIDRVG